MPRLVGKSSKTPRYIGISFLAAIAVVGVLEYTGTIDLVPEFGQSRKPTGRLNSSMKQSTTP
jgi:hypothetical protein